MSIVALVAVAVVVLMLRRRRHRKLMHAGLVATKPTFTVEPPRRHLSTLKDQRL